jgi:hypothetical protein
MPRNYGRKGYLLPEVLEPETYKSVCVTIPDDPAHLRAFVGQIYRLTYWNTWQRNPTHEGRLAARAWQIPYDAVVAALDAAQECGGPTMKLRQNPLDSCQLQFSNDDGGTWELAFDYGLCITPSEQAILDIIQDIRDGQIGLDPPSNTIIHPLAPTDSFGGDVDDPLTAALRREALCYALEITINILVEMYRAARDGGLNAPVLASTVLGLVQGVAGLLKANIWLQLGIILAQGFLQAFLNLALNQADAVLDSQANRDAWKCLALKNMMNLPAKEESMNFMFRYGECLTPDQASVADDFTVILSDAIQRHDMFLAFLNALGDATSLALQGALADECACAPTGSWSATFWFSATAGGVVRGSIGNAQGWTIGANTQILDGVRNVDNSCLNTWRLTRNVPLPPGTTITTLAMQVQSYGSANAHYFIKNNGVVVFDGGVSSGPLATVSAPVNLTGYCSFDIYCQNTGGCVQAVYYLQMTGTGDNPFSPCAVVNFED